MQKHTIITLQLWKLICPLPCKLHTAQWCIFVFFRYEYLQQLHNGYAQNVIRMYAFLKCNELRNHHTQLTMHDASTECVHVYN